MIRTNFLPLNELKIRPAFWGVERDLGQMMDSIESIWGGAEQTLTEFEETDQAYLMSIDIPGISKDDLEIEMVDEKIVITGSRKKTFSDQLMSEKISKSIALPKFADKEKIEAHHENGVLYLAFPKIEKAKSRKIKITDGSKESSWKNLLGFKKKEEKNL